MAIIDVTRFDVTLLDTSLRNILSTNSFHIMLTLFDTAVFAPILSLK